MTAGRPASVCERAGTGARKDGADKSVSPRSVRSTETAAPEQIPRTETQSETERETDSERARETEREKERQLSVAAAAPTAVQAEAQKEEELD